MKVLFCLFSILMFSSIVECQTFYRPRINVDQLDVIKNMDIKKSSDTSAPASNYLRLAYSVKTGRAYLITSDTAYTDLLRLDNIGDSLATLYTTGVSGDTAFKALVTGYTSQIADSIRFTGDWGITVTQSGHVITFNADSSEVATLSDNLAVLDSLANHLIRIVAVEDSIDIHRMAIDGKAATSHTHAISAVTELADTNTAHRNRISALEDTSGIHRTAIDGKEPTITTLPMSKGGTGNTSITSSEFLVVDLEEQKIIASPYNGSSFEAADTNIQNHLANTSNPHSVTKTQVGLGNVENTSDANKPISTATQTALDLKTTTSTLRQGAYHSDTTFVARTDSLTGFWITAYDTTAFTVGDTVEVVHLDANYDVHLITTIDEETEVRAAWAATKESGIWKSVAWTWLNGYVGYGQLRYEFVAR